MRYVMTCSCTAVIQDLGPQTFIRATLLCSKYFRTAHPCETLDVPHKISLGLRHNLTQKGLGLGVTHRVRIVSLWDLSRGFCMGRPSSPAMAWMFGDSV